MNNLAWLVCSTFGLASEVWLYRQATRMQRHRVRVVTWNWANRQQFPAVNCEVVVAPATNEQSRGRAFGWLRRLSNMRQGHFGTTPDETAWLREQIRIERPAVILSHFGNTGIRVSAAAQAEGVPLVVHFHGADLSSLLRSWYYRASLRRAVPRIRRFVIVADYMRGALESLGAPPDRIVKIPCGVPLDDFTLSAGVGEPDCRFLMLGRLLEKKRPDLSIRAFALAAAGHPRARLVVIGDGDFMPEVRRLVDELHLADRVELLGAQPPDRVRAELARASVFVQHSVTAASGDKEGWPVSIAEAAASGLPIVSTRHASIPEQVEHEESGLLCNEGDWRTMGEHMRRLAGNATLRRSMGAAARSRIEPFDTGRQIAMLEDVLVAAAES